MYPYDHLIRKSLPRPRLTPWAVLISAEYHSRAAPIFEGIGPAVRATSPAIAAGLQFSTECTLMHRRSGLSMAGYDCQRIGAPEMKRTTIHLSSSQCAALAKRSKETGAPIAEVIRRAIDEYLVARPASRPAGPARLAKR
jgi:hypothetical protein